MKKQTPKAGIKPKEKIEKISLPKVEVELVTFSLKATIPTQQYGNIMPEFVVKSKSIRAAMDEIFPIMEHIYQEYAEIPLNGKVPRFFKKEVIVTEKIVNEIPVPQGKEDAAVNAQKVSPVKTDKDGEKDPEPFVKTEPYIKAENAITSAQSIEALDLLEYKIKLSSKILDEDKPFLFTLILKKKKNVK